MPNHRARLAGFAIAAAIAIVLALAIADARPVGLPSPGADTVPCLSYAPFRRPGATPLGVGTRVTPAQIAADLAVLRTRTGCVRTYGVSHGLDAVPAAARTLGMRVRLGAWIGRDAAQNAAELALAVRLARAHPDVVEMLIVGNEVLLRGDADAGTLAALLDHARREAGVPVAYADVWEFWLRHAQVLRAHVDVAAVHVLPYWEDEPVEIGLAVEHVLRTFARTRDALAPTPVWLGETGWPSAGRQRERARPGLVAQARFVRELSAAAAGLPFNLIEGFDQPWKRALEGAMGGAWGVFGADAKPKFPWRGPVREAPAMLAATVTGLLAGLLAGALASLFGGPLAGARGAPGRGTMVLSGGLVGALAPAQLAWIATWCRTPWEIGLAASVAVGGGAHALIAASRHGALRATDPLSHDPLSHGPPSHGSLSPGSPWRGHAERIAAALVVGAALAHAGALLWSPRYLGFASVLFAAPAAALLALAIAGTCRPRSIAGACPPRPAGDSTAQRGILLGAAGIALAMAAILVAIREGPHNGQALAWAAIVATLGLGFAATHARSPLSVHRRAPTKRPPAASS